MVPTRAPANPKSVATVATVTIIMTTLVVVGVMHSRFASHERAVAAASASIDAVMAERQAVSSDIDEIATAFTEGRSSLDAAVAQLEQRLAQTSWYPYSELRERSRELHPPLTERAFLATVLVRKPSGNSTTTRSGLRRSFAK